jgi:hypothetical protein
VSPRLHRRALPTAKLRNAQANEGFRSKCRVTSGANSDLGRPKNELTESRAVRCFAGSCPALNTKSNLQA